jgi:hypothetical protein
MRGPLSATPGRGLTRQYCTSHRRQRVVLCYDTVRPQLHAVPCSFFICTSPWALLISSTSNGSVGSMQTTKRPTSPKISHGVPTDCKLVPADVCRYMYIDRWPFPIVLHPLGSTRYTVHTYRVYRHKRFGGRIVCELQGAYMSDGYALVWRLGRRCTACCTVNPVSSLAAFSGQVCHKRAYREMRRRPMATHLVNTPYVHTQLTALRKLVSTSKCRNHRSNFSCLPKPAILQRVGAGLAGCPAPARCKEDDDLPPEQPRTLVPDWPASTSRG